MGEDIFYRLIFTEKQNPDFSLPDCKFVQVLIYNNKIAAVGSYNIKMNISLVNYEQKLYALFYSIDIVEVSQKAIGIMLSRVAVPVNKDSNFTGIQNNQPYGEVELSYLEMSQLKDIDFKAAYEGYGIACFPYDNALSVYASPCLVDNSIPLKYGLQNAFDHNHSTSYVENTKDDLINIYFFKNGPELFTISAFAVINGYAQNSTLYYNNNRVKKIGSTTKFNGSWDNFRIMELKNNYIERELAEITDYPEHLTYTIKKIGHLNPMLIHICNM